jgi:cytochrome P450
MNKPIPSSHGLPLLGHFFSYKKNRLQMLEKVSLGHQDIFRLKVGPRKLIVINSAELVQEIMQNQMDNFIKKINFDQIFGQSIFITNGSAWKKQRRLVQPLFSPKYMDKSFERISKITQNELESFINSSKNGVDIRELFIKITFEVIMECIIGIQHENNYKFIDKALVDLTHYLTNDNYNFIPKPYFLDPEKQAFDSSLKKLNDFVYSSIDEALNSDQAKHSLVNIMMTNESLKNEVSDLRLFVRNNIVTMMFAGYETSALSLTWLCYSLSKNQQWQERCREEIKNLDIEKISLIDLNNLPLCDACIYETLRMYPAGWAFTRTAKNETSIKDYKIAKGETVLISPYLIHRNEKIFDKPNNFNPNRFLAKKFTDYGRFQYIPFGAGPRICSGMQFAMMEMRLILIHLLSDYKVTLVGEEPQLDARATLFSKNGYQIKLERLQS